VKKNVFAGIVAGSLGLLTCDMACAANAVFAADGKAVFTITEQADFPLNKMDVASGVATPVKVAMGKDDVLVGIASAESNELYLATQHALWRWTPGSPRARWVEDAPKRVELVDVACHVPSGRVLLAAQIKSKDDKHCAFYCKPERRRPMLYVSIRYPPGDVLENPVFLPDGSFLFSADGDLWHGMLEDGGENLKPGDKPDFFNLYAYRYAPIADRNTQPGTPFETGISAIAISQKKVYVHFSRMYGSGWGSVLRLNLPVQEKGKWANLNSAKDVVRTLSSIEEVYDMTEGGSVYLCASLDGQLMYGGERSSGKYRTLFIVDDEKIKR